MAARIQFGVYLTTIGFSTIILVKSIILVPEEVLDNPELSTILFISIIALIERCEQLWDSIKRNYSPITPLSESPAREPEVVDLLPPHCPNDALGE